VFGTIKVMSGGVGSAFNHVKPHEYKAKLFCVSRTKGNATKVEECKTTTRAELNHADVFILDAGFNLWQWNGKNANIWEKRKGEEVLEGIENERGGRTTKAILAFNDDDAKFWGLLGGPGAVAEGESKAAAAPAAAGADPDAWHASAERALHRVDVAPGATEATFAPIRVGGAKVEWGDFKQDQVFILDVTDENKLHHLFVHVGSLTSKSHLALALEFGEEYRVKKALAHETRVVRVVEGGPRDVMFIRAVEEAPAATA